MVQTVVVPSLSMMVIRVIFLNITSGSDVIRATVKISSSSSAPSSTIEMFVHLVESSMDPEVKV